MRGFIAQAATLEDLSPKPRNMRLSKSSKETGDTHTQEQPSKDDVFSESPKVSGDTHAKQEKKQTMLLKNPRKKQAAPTPQQPFQCGF